MHTTLEKLYTIKEMEGFGMNFLIKFLHYSRNNFSVKENFVLFTYDQN